MRSNRGIAGIALVALLALATGCSHRDGTQKKIQAAIKGGKQEFQLKELTPFDWDQVVVGRYDATRSELEAQTGRLGNQFQEFHRNVVFMKGGRPVHCEQWAVNIEHPENGEVSFKEEETNRVFRYQSGVKFHLSKVPIPTGEYFVLVAE